MLLCGLLLLLGTLLSQHPLLLLLLCGLLLLLGTLLSQDLLLLLCGLLLLLGTLLSLHPLLLLLLLPGLLLLLPAAGSLPLILLFLFGRRLLRANRQAHSHQ